MNKWLLTARRKRGRLMRSTTKLHVAQSLACWRAHPTRIFESFRKLMGANTVRTSARKRDGSVKVYQVYLTEEGKKFFTQTRISSPKYV